MQEECNMFNHEDSFLYFSKTVRMYADAFGR